MASWYVAALAVSGVTGYAVAAVMFFSRRRVTKRLQAKITELNAQNYLSVKALVDCENRLKQQQLYADLLEHQAKTAQELRGMRCKTRVDDSVGKVDMICAEVQAHLSDALGGPRQTALNGRGKDSG